MVIVIDFDGTLALGDTNDINKMYPNLKLTVLLNQMHTDGNYIKIVTARGSKSCNTVQERENKYKSIITDWLFNHNIKYHELSFMKDYGDIYVDDRGYNIKDALIYNKLDSKFTTNKVRRLNNFVIKKCNLPKQEVDWYSKALEIGLDIPTVMHYDIDTITTSFIDGTKCDDINLILNTIQKFKTIPPTNNVNFESYINRIALYIKNNPSIKSKNILNLLKKINPPNTFNHGDFSVHNQIMANNKLYLIDPIYSDDLYQSYYIDIAKHLFSILYYNLDVDFYNLCYNEYVSKLEINTHDLNTLIACESIRVSNRKPQLIDISNNLIDAL
jgi:tRNA A-37 threonylcarbamoyl transferase component Bud32